jgi:hypothetical protein
MSVDEMMEELDSPHHFYLPETTIKVIKEALRAGQAMRDAIEVSPPNTTGYAANIDKPLGTAHGYDAGSAALAWDAATREDV